MRWKTLLLVAVITVFLYYLDDYMNGCKYESDIRLDGKVVIVTGANTGIGKETAKDLVTRGAKVYMACRSLERGQAALDDILNKTAVNKEQLILLKLDLASLNSIREFAKAFKQWEHRLDILINNAGLMFLPYSKTEDGFEMILGINHLGHFLLTNLLIDILLSSAPSRIVTISSLAHIVGTIDFDNLMYEKNYNRIYAYSHSKLANILFANEIARRLQGTGVTSYSLHPGAVSTDIIRHVPVINWPPVTCLFYFILEPFIKNAYQGSRTQIYVAIEPGLEVHNGEHFSDCARTEPSGAARDDKVAEKLWNVSLELVKLHPDEIHPKLRM